jgi:hypothetical protein
MGTKLKGNFAVAWADTNVGNDAEWGAGHPEKIKRLRCPHPEAHYKRPGDPTQSARFAYAGTRNSKPWATVW